MKFKIKMPTENQVGARGLKVFINDTFIPRVGAIENPKDVSATEIYEGVYEIECEGVLLYEDKENHYLRLKILNGGEIDD